MEASEIIERADKKRERRYERIRGRPTRLDVRVHSFAIITHRLWNFIKQINGLVCYVYFFYELYIFYLVSCENEK
jgi:hypothetical protein